MPEAPTSPARIAAVDVLRGLTMAGMIVVNKGIGSTSGVIARSDK
jgi:predicted acyltransferase